MNAAFVAQGTTPDGHAVYEIIPQKERTMNKTQTAAAEELANRLQETFPGSTVDSTPHAPTQYRPAVFSVRLPAGGGTITFGSMLKETPATFFLLGH